MYSGESFPNFINGQIIGQINSVTDNFLVIKIEFIRKMQPHGFVFIAKFKELITRKL